MNKTEKSYAPKCPDPEDLQKSIDTFAEMEIADEALQTKLLNALDWLVTFLENRNTYHKKQNLKNKILREKMKELGLDEEVNSLTNSALFDHVAKAGGGR